MTGSRSSIPATKKAVDCYVNLLRKSGEPGATSSGFTECETAMDRQAGSGSMHRRRRPSHNTNSPGAKTSACIRADRGDAARYTGYVVSLGVEAS